MELRQNAGFLKQPNRWNRIKTDATGGPSGPVTPATKSNSKTFPVSVSGFRLSIPESLSRQRNKLSSQSLELEIRDMLLTPQRVEPMRCHDVPRRARTTSAFFLLPVSMSVRHLDLKRPTPIYKLVHKSPQGTIEEATALPVLSKCGTFR